MNPAAGLLDLAGWTSSAQGVLCPLVDEPDRLIHVGGMLDLARQDRRPELPDLTVELVRGESPLLPPEPYGLLDLRLRSRPVPEDVLDAARRTRPGSTVEAATFSGGHLRLLLAGSASLDAASRERLEAPVPMASNGLDAGRVLTRLPVEAALLLRAALAEGVATFTAVAEMVVRALCERLPVTVRFPSGEVLAALASHGDADGRIAVDRIAAWWREHANSFVIVDGRTADDPGRLAAVLADRTLAEWGTPAAAPGRQVVATVRLRRAAPDDGVATWDLSRGRTTSRTVLLRLDPFAAAREALAGGDPLRLWRETVVPPLDTGEVTISVETNLPSDVQGLVRLAVELSAPAHPPLRVHRLSAGLVLDGVQKSVRWRMSPREPRRWEYSVVAMVDVGGGVTVHRTPARPTEDRSLLLGVDDLPFRLVVLEASERLLAQAEVQVELRRSPEVTGPDEAVADPAAPAARAVAMQLTALRPVVAVPVPPDVPEGLFSLEASLRDAAGETVRLGPLAAVSTWLDLTSFPQYGRQDVDVCVEFDDDAPLVALALHPDRPAPDGGSAEDVVTFTPAAPARRWSYRNPTPFRSGFRYRRAAPPGAWSELQSPGVTLRLRSSDLARDGEGGTVAHPDADEPARVGGLLCLPTDRPDTVAVIPLVPRPEHDGTGRPVLMRLPMGDATLLQLGTTLGPHDDDVEQARDECARRHALERSAVTVIPAPLTVERAVLLAVAEGGDELQLAESRTSGYPPYNAVFSVQLQDAAAEAVDAALAGEHGRLRVRYDVTLVPGGAPVMHLPEVATDVSTWAGLTG